VVRLAEPPPLKGPEGKGGSARQTHDRAALPFKEWNEELFELATVEIKSD